MEINSVPITYFFAVAFASFLLGISKSGIKGLAILIVTIFALVYDAKSSTGIVMPLLILGDIFAVIYYNRHTKWEFIKKLIPWMIIGVLIGVFFGKDIPENTFKVIMAIIIFASTLLMYFWENKPNKKVPNHPLFSFSMGILAGFTTMIGNLAGSFANIYFLAIRLPKNEFIGTAAWLFFIINFFKLPFHIFIWKTINIDSLYNSLILSPFLIIGLLTGVKIVKKIKNDSYRKLILFFTGLGAIIILFK